MKDGDQGKQVHSDGPATWIRQGRRHWRKWLVLALLVVLAVPVGYRLWVSSYASSVPQYGGGGHEPIVVYIPPDSGFAAIKQALIDRQVIDDDIRFGLLARRMGAVGKLQAGEYCFTADLSHQAIIEKLARGEVSYRPLTVPEGFNIFQIGDLLASGFGYDRNDFLRQVQDAKLIKSVGLDVPSLEGYLFPDTYFVTRGQMLNEIVAMMVHRFNKVYNEISKQNQGASPSVPQAVSRHEIVILASIVEKETALPDERPLIAAVFLNRLKNNMKLQADPTVIYGIADFNGNITRQDLITPSPYNTYTKTGLPAGPIANPGKESLVAVLHPAATGYLYFVAQNDGSHFFSSTLEEHNRAVIRFQKQRRLSAQEPAMGEKQ
ncbi:MAG: endolytic transglycosylase MltG [Thermodesulfobacteriota bacterium]